MELGLVGDVELGLVGDVELELVVDVELGLVGDVKQVGEELQGLGQGPVVGTQGQEGEGDGMAHERLVLDVVGVLED